MKNLRFPKLLILVFSLPVFLNALSEAQQNEIQQTTKFGILVVKSKPSGADVFIDNSDTTWGQTPYTTGLLYGSHRIILKHGSYFDFDTTIAVYVGKKVTIKARMIKLGVGILSINTVPGGVDILLDNKPVGKSPAEIDVSVGSHDIMVALDGYITKNRVVEISPGERNEIEFKLNEQTSGIIIDVDPDNAEITIGGKSFKSGQVITLIPGNYTATITSSNYYPETRDIEIKKAEITEINLSLNRIKKRVYKYGFFGGFNLGYNEGKFLPPVIRLANEKRFRWGLFVGGYTCVKISHSYALRPEISYVSKRIKYGQKLYIYYPGQVEEWYKMGLDYINISLLLSQAGIDKEGLSYLAFGPSISFLVSKSLSGVSPVFDSGPVELDASDSYWAFDIAMGVGKAFFIEARLHMGITPFLDYYDRKIIDARTVAGYRF